MKVIETKSAPGAIGPYSQAFITGNMVITSGQIPVNPADGTIAEGISEQTRQSCLNVKAILEAAGSSMEKVVKTTCFKAILEAAGSSMEKVVKTTCFLADMGDFAAFNEVYAQYFTGKPARSCVAVKTLPKNVLCEIEAIAEL